MQMLVLVSQFERLFKLSAPLLAEIQRETAIETADRHDAIQVR